MSCKFGFNIKNIIETTEEKCTNYPFWNDFYGDSCDAYQLQQYCTENGGIGVNWNPSWGTFEENAEDGISATQACCKCGGGTKYKIDTNRVTCVCPDGSTEKEGSCIPNDPNAFIVQTGTQQQEKCVDIDPTLGFFGFVNCDQYRNYLMCDPKSPDRKGVYWMEESSYLLDNCCVCGGGNRTQIQEPVYSVVCQDGFEMVDGLCIYPEKCPEGRKCPEGSTKVEDECIYPGKCPEGSTKVEDECLYPGKKKYNLLFGLIGGLIGIILIWYIRKKYGSN